VEVTAAEVFSLARAIRALTVDRQAELLERIEATALMVIGLTSEEHYLSRVSCALLEDDGSCGMYGARPIGCRRAHSLDASVCAAVHDDPTIPRQIPESSSFQWNESALVVGYYEGMEHAGHPPDQHELIAALRLALAENEVSEQPHILLEARTKTADEVRQLLTNPSVR
jgi:hypothetical protein